MIYLLDTMVMTELTRDTARRDRNMAGWLATVDDIELATSALVVREMWDEVVALRRDHRKASRAVEIERRITSLLDSFDYRIVPVDRAVAELWAELLPGRSKRDMDVGIAATARVRGLIVVTRNLQDLIGLGVRLIDPFQSPAAVHEA